MLAIFDLIQAIIDWKGYTAPKRKIRRVRRTARGFMIDYIR